MIFFFFDNTHRPARFISALLPTCKLRPRKHRIPGFHFIMDAAALAAAAAAALPRVSVAVDAADAEAVVTVSALELAAVSPELGQAAMDDPG